MSKTRSYAQILIGSRLFLTAMAIHLSLRVAPLDLQQGGNSRIPYWGFRGRPMWGTFWVWDARLTSVFISFLIYLGALCFQKLPVEPAPISIRAGPIDIPKSSLQSTGGIHRINLGALADLEEIEAREGIPKPSSLAESLCIHG
ncbi:UNVERIFIED_CONTAM: putative cytochrome c biosynthesis ccmC-like mitochondrial protein [Sesamum angustifolium]|uniref:Cytochrome c biosynthesis ccmC-like mitochondrial protein n=1 Tax=Sesamum angustifolium TaxID=2727405 RepID=A0AAW2JKU4_9LAMI